MVDEQFFTDGLRASVTAPNDDRVFTYDHYALRKEIHRAGPWSGWSVERIPDGLGRLGTIRVTGGHSVARDFVLAYDGYSRLQGVRTGGVLGVYSREDPATHVQTGQIRTLTRGSLLSTWKYNDKLQLSEVTNARPGRPTFGYSYPDRNLDARGRVQKRTATIGRSWKDLSYDGTSQLKGADVDGRRVLSYSYDARGNRETQGPSGSNQQPAATHAINGLDQISGRTLTERGFGILGHVTPGAAVQVQSAAQPQSALNLDSGSGEFYGYWTVSQGGAGGRVTALVQGSLAGLGVNGTSAVAEEELSFVLPPSDEVIDSDYAGRTKADGFWTYQWSDSGQLRRMIRKPGMFAQVGVSAEELSFVYDAEGRRTKKTRTLTYSTGRQTVEVSRVLWSGWLPVLEERSRNGQISARRWFLWGADLSGTLEGAGGIGGLVAIVEEKPDGRSRTLYPVQDGLGNVTAVLDAADGATVARFDYGPFGEPLGEYGDVDACPFRFQTKWYDRESEHYYYGYRYYSPRLGRWLSRDPLGEDGGVNLYAYCGNDPVNRHDPTGLSAFSDLLDSAGGDLAQGRYIRGYGKTTIAALWEAFSFRAASRIGDVQDLYDEGEITGEQAFSAGSIIVAHSATEAALTFGGGNFAGGFVRGGATVLGKGLRGGVTGAAFGFAIPTLEIGANRGVAAVEGREYEGTFESDALNVAVSTGVGFGLGATLSTGGAFFEKWLTKSHLPADIVTKTVEGAGKGVFVDDLSHLTGKTAASRNMAISSLVNEDLAALKLTHAPQYSPFVEYGMAKQGVGTHVGAKAFQSRAQLRDTIVHEELHHRWWRRGIFDHHPAGSAKEAKFYKTLERYLQMRRWK